MGKSYKKGELSKRTAHSETSVSNVDKSSVGLKVKATKTSKMVRRVTPQADTHTPWGVTLKPVQRLKKMDEESTEVVTTKCGFESKPMETQNPEHQRRQSLQSLNNLPEIKIEEQGFEHEKRDGDIFDDERIRSEKEKEVRFKVK